MINATTIAAILSNLTVSHLRLLAEIATAAKGDATLTEREARSGDEDLYCDLGRAGLIHVGCYSSARYSYDWNRNYVVPTALAFELFRLVNPEFPGCPTSMIEPRDAYDCSFESVEQLPLFVERTLGPTEDLVEGDLGFAPGGFLVSGELEAWRV